MCVDWMEMLNKAQPIVDYAFNMTKKIVSFDLLFIFCWHRIMDVEPLIKIFKKYLLFFYCSFETWQSFLDFFFCFLPEFLLSFLLCADNFGLKFVMRMLECWIMLCFGLNVLGWNSIFLIVFFFDGMWLW